MTVIDHDATLPGVVRRRSAKQYHVPGELGMCGFILADLAAFTVLFGAHLYHRGQDPDLFAASQQSLSQTYGALNTLVLLTSSLFVVLGVQAVRDRTNGAPWLFTAAFGCGLGFVTIKFFEWGDKFDAGIGAGTNGFFMYYFILTGVHLVHVVLGLGLLGALVVLSRDRVSASGRIAFIEGSACFWHLVDLLWIVLFPLLYFVK